jgi:hypothetical protein
MVAKLVLMNLRDSSENTQRNSANKNRKSWRFRKSKRKQRSRQ